MRLQARLGMPILLGVALNLLVVFSLLGLLDQVGPNLRLLEREHIARLEVAGALLGVASAHPERARSARAHLDAAIAGWRASRQEDSEDSWVSGDGQAARVRVPGSPGEEPAEGDIEDARREAPLVPATLERLLETYGDAAAVGDPDARVALTRAAHEFLRREKSAWEGTLARVRRLGDTGAWGAVLVGLCAMGGGMWAIIRLQQGVLRPILEARDVLSAATQGGHHRRCRSFQTAKELTEVLERINVLLDVHEEARDAGEFELRQQDDLDGGRGERASAT